MGKERPRHDLCPMTVEAGFLVIVECSVRKGVEIDHDNR